MEKYTPKLFSRRILACLLLYNNHPTFVELNHLTFFSAGVGETGIYIAVDRLLQEIRVKDEVDVMATVLEMRQQRAFMVQTEVCEHAHIFYLPISKWKYTINDQRGDRL